MSDLYNKDYYRNCCGLDYSNKEHWEKFFGYIADRIVTDFKPKTVLDSGCAWGYLVAALRDRGVEAYGIDISDYAISMVRDDIKPFCRVSSLTLNLPADLPQKYDLVTNIEVIEHLYEDDGLIAISNLCKWSDTIIFSSTPDDITEKTHFNVQQSEYWIKQFAKNGFYNDVNYVPNYISAAALKLYKSQNFVRVVEDYERNRRIINSNYRNLEKVRKLSIFTSKLFFDMGDGYSEQDSVSFKIIGDEINVKYILPRSVKSIRFDPVEDLECIINNFEVYVDNNKLNVYNNGFTVDNFDVFSTQDSQYEVSSNILCAGCTLMFKGQVYIFDNFIIGELFNKLESFKNQADYLSINNEELSSENKLQKKEITNYIKKVNELNYTITTILNSTCWRITKPVRAVGNILKKKIKNNILLLFFYRGLKYLKNNGYKATLKKIKNMIFKNSYKKSYILSKEQRYKQSNTIFEKSIKFSILVPLYNTPKKFLKEMINSVIKQTYSNWELCMVDGSDNEHAYVGSVCDIYSKNDSRIKYKKLEENLGISENTNKCIELSTGDYIALFDHDDLLHPSALYENMIAICEKGADFIYTDENTFSNKPSDAYCPHFKPDFSIDTLRSYNYICHFTVFSKKLLAEAGIFRKEYDGSQDYDIILRLIEKAQRIVHIPQILYYWRAHNNSVASDISAKPYVIDAAKKALADHLDRIGLEGEVVNSSILSTYKTNYKIIGNPLVSIIIPNKDAKEDLKKCIDSILDLSTYKNFEIIIIENNSSKKDIFEYYRGLSYKNNIKIVNWEHKFNYSAINNFGVNYASGEYLILLNNDIKIITSNWIEEMLMFAQRKDVGAVGAKLYYPDDTIQHAGVILGLGGVAGHSHKNYRRNSFGYSYRLKIVQNLTAVTAACMMMRRDVFEQIKGFDEAFEVAFNDVDLCMRIRQNGYLIVFTPYAELYHYESKTRGYEDTSEKQERFKGEVLRFKRKWAKELEAGDPYYNPNLTLDREDFSIK